MKRNVKIQICRYINKACAHMHTYTCAQNLIRPAITCTVIVFMLNADDHLLAKVPRGNMLFLF